MKTTKRTKFSITVCIEGETSQKVTAYFKRHRGELTRPIVQVILARTDQFTRVQETLRYMQTHCCRNDLRAKEVAAHVGWNTKTLSTLFRKLLSETYISRLTKMRIATATSLFQRHWRVGHVAKSVGFGTVEAFLDAFKRTTGLKPGAYRIWLAEKRNGHSQ